MSGRLSIDVMRKALQNMSSQLSTDELHDDAQSEASYDIDCEAQSNDSVDLDGDSRSNTSIDPDHYPEEDFSFTTFDVMHRVLQIADAADKKVEHVQRSVLHITGAMEEKFESIRRKTCAAYDQRISDMEAQFKELQESLCSGYERRISQTEKVCQELLDNQSILMDRIAHLEASNRMMRNKIEKIADDLNANFSKVKKFMCKLPKQFVRDLKGMLQDYHSIKLGRHLERGISNGVSMLSLMSPRPVVLLLEDVKEQESIAKELVALPGSDAVELPLDVSLVPFSAAFFYGSGKNDLDETLGDLGERLENIGEHIEDIGERLQVVRNNLDRCSSYFFNVYVFTMCPHQKDIPDTIMNNIKYWAPFYVFLFLFLLVMNPQKMCRIMDKNFGPALDYAGQLVVPVFEFFCERLMYIWDWLFREYFAVGLS